MEFLHPSRYDYQTVVLVLVVQNGSKTALMRYDWDCSSSLESTQTIINRHPTPSGLGMPLFLVPLTTSPGFILLGQKRLAVYSSFAPGSDKADVSNLEEEFHSDNYSPIHPGTSKEFPLLTTWARPMRRDGWADEHAFLYFCREDGLIIYFDFQRLSNRLSYAKVGELNINIGTAFAILTSGIAGDEDGNQGSSDTLVAAGSMSNGGLFRFRSRQPGHQLQPIPNWSPVLDFTVVERQINPRSDSPASLLGQQDHAQARLFVCAGEGDFGSLYELRKAIEAQTVTTISLDDDNKNSTTIQRIWLLPALSSTAGPEDGVHLLASYHDQTHVIYVGAGQDVHDDIAPHLRALVDLESKTIAAGTTTSGFAIQVTPRMITAVNLSASMEDRPPIRYPLESDLVLQASVDGISGSVIVIVQTNVEKTLRYSRLLPHSKQPTFSQPTRPVTLRQDPTCVLLQNLDSGLFVFVGTFDGSLLVYRVFENNIVTEQRAVSLEADGTGCESIIVLADPSRCNTQSYLILCGLRNGALQVLRFEHESDQGNISIHKYRVYSLI